MGDKGRYPGIEMKRTGSWLRCICTFKNIPVKKLCECLSLGSPQSVYGWFCGRTLPFLDNFYALSQVLDMSLGELIVNQEELIPGEFRKRIGKDGARLFCYRLKFEL